MTNKNIYGIISYNLKYERGINMGNVSTVGYVVKASGNTYNTSDIVVTDDRFLYIRIDDGIVKVNCAGTYIVLIEEYGDRVEIMQLPVDATLTDVINILITQLENCVLEEIEVIMDDF